MGKQFAGIPTTSMGRREYHDRPTTPRSIELFQVKLDDGGYDDGGAYWGKGQPLFCARAHENADSDYREFTRANSRDDAADKLRIPDKLLSRGRTKVQPSLI